MAFIHHHHIILIDRRRFRRIDAVEYPRTSPWMVQMWTLVSRSGVTSARPLRPKIAAKVFPETSWVVENSPCVWLPSALRSTTKGQLRFASPCRHGDEHGPAACLDRVLDRLDRVALIVAEWKAELERLLLEGVCCSVLIDFQSASKAIRRRPIR